MGCSLKQRCLTGMRGGQGCGVRDHVERFGGVWAGAGDGEHAQGVAVITAT